LAEVEELQAKVIERSIAKPRDDHPDTLERIDNLALMYWTQRILEGIEDLEVEVIELGMYRPPQHFGMHGRSRLLSRLLGRG
jgi:hypothetical protein